MGGFSTIGVDVKKLTVSYASYSAIPFITIDALYELPILIGYSPRGLSSSSTGVKHETKSMYIPPWTLPAFSEAYFEASLLQLTDGTIALELFDGSTVIDSITLTATTYRTRSTKNILYSIMNKEVRGRLNVTVAGASGSLAGDATYAIILVRR